MTRIEFNRTAGTATCPDLGITVQHDHDPPFGLIRVLADMGRDGPWAAADEHDTQCWFGHRLAKAARRYRPTEAEAADIATKARAEREAKDPTRRDAA